MTSAADLFPREVSIRRSVSLPVPADVAWQSVRELDSPVLVGGMVERIELHGTGEGTVRTFHLAGGGSVIERIEQYSETDRCYAYRIIDSGPLPVQRYLGMAAVTADGDSRSRLTWHGMADPAGIDSDSLRAMMDGNLQQALDAFAGQLGANDGSA